MPATRLVAPMTLVGLTALSVETKTNLSTPWRSAASIHIRVPTMLLSTASSGLISIMGTCLWAAAWKTILGRCSSITASALSRLRTLPMTVSICRPGCSWRISRSIS